MVGRQHEIGELETLYGSGRSELVAIYGRRRIGKTYLVDEVFKDRITFRHTGLSPVEAGDRPGGLLKAQLQHFYYSLQMHGMKKSHRPGDWLEAFFMLEQHLASLDDGDRQVVFLDELPWLDTPNSRFVTAFEAFWNSWACHRSNMMVIVCGSANSWILDKLINNHGGLYNRVTHEIKLSPFSMGECRSFLDSKGIRLSDYDIAQSYMILGGVPFYLGYFERGRSLAQAVDMLFFRSNAKLRNEYERLFDSCFSNPDAMKAIVSALGTRNAGLSRKELVEKLRVMDGGHLSKHLKALVSSDFVMEYVPFGLSRRETHYKLADPFCLFYLKFVSGRTDLDESFWQHGISSQFVISWRGFAFENLCFNHIRQIKGALGISGVITACSAWSKRPDDTEGTQVDLIIKRRDNVIDMCEIKFYGDDFVVSKDYHQTLMRRQELLSGIIPRKFVIHGILVTTFGLAYNEYSGDFLQVVTLGDLMKE